MNWGKKNSIMSFHGESKSDLFLSGIFFLAKNYLPLIALIGFLQKPYNSFIFLLYSTSSIYQEGAGGGVCFFVVHYYFIS
jgi:hypothetical protein